MFRELKKKRAGRDSISAQEYNLMQRVLRNLMKSMGVNSVMCGSGLHFRKSAGADETEMFIAKVVSDAAGAGVYNCYIQKLDATNWETGDSVLTNQDTDSIEVLNLIEDGGTSWNLDADDYLICWKKDDDEGNSRYIGIELLGRYTHEVW